MKWQCKWNAGTVPLASGGQVIGLLVAGGGQADSWWRVAAGLPVSAKSTACLLLIALHYWPTMISGNSCSLLGPLFSLTSDIICGQTIIRLAVKLDLWLHIRCVPTIDKPNGLIPATDDESRTRSHPIKTYSPCPNRLSHQHAVLFGLVLFAIVGH